MGRYLAYLYKQECVEYWPFLRKCLNLSKDSALDEIEMYLQKQLVSHYVLEFLSKIREIASNVKPKELTLIQNQLSDANNKKFINSFESHNYDLSNLKVMIDLRFFFLILKFQICFSMVEFITCYFYHSQAFRMNKN